MDKRFENIFLNLREENGAEFSLDKEECIEFARTVFAANFRSIARKRRKALVFLRFAPSIARSSG